MADLVRESLALAIENLEDVFSAHRDPKSRDYNECEKPNDECQWCADALKGIEGIQGALDQLSEMERDREAMEKLGNTPDSLLRHYADSNLWYWYPDAVNRASVGDNPTDAILGKESGNDD